MVKRGQVVMTRDFLIEQFKRVEDFFGKQSNEVVLLKAWFNIFGDQMEETFKKSIDMLINTFKPYQSCTFPVPEDVFKCIRIISSDIYRQEVDGKLAKWDKENEALGGTATKEDWNEFDKKIEVLRSTPGVLSNNNETEDEIFHRKRKLAKTQSQIKNESNNKNRKKIISDHDELFF